MYSNSLKGKISIIIPVYNVVKYLKKCINSVINQTYTDLEIILVDDGSNDGSGELCDKYAKKDSRIKVIHKANGGQGAARNVALDIATGDYIGFVDSDDWILPDMFEDLLRALIETKSDMSICGAINDHVFIQKKYKYFDSTKVFDKKQLMQEYLGTPHIGCALWNKLYKRELWNGVRIPEVRAREDIMVIHLLVGQCQRAVHIGECKYVQLVRPGSTEQKFTLNKLSVIEAQKIIIEYVSENFFEMTYLVELNIAKECVALMQEILVTDINKYKKEFDNLHCKLKTELKLHASHNQYNDKDYHDMMKICKDVNILRQQAVKLRMKYKFINALKTIGMRIKYR